MGQGSGCAILVLIFFVAAFFVGIGGLISPSEDSETALFALIIGGAGLGWIGYMIYKGHVEGEQQAEWKRQEEAEDKNARSDDAYSRLVYGKSGVKIKNEPEKQPTEASVSQKPKELPRPYDGYGDDLFD